MNDATDLLDSCQRGAFSYFERFTHAGSGLVADCSSPDSHASIAASGFSLASLVIGAERGWTSRATAAERAASALKFLSGAGQSHGFFFHFLDPVSGQRAGRCEVSTMDSSILFAGAIAAAEYFDGDDPLEREIRSRALDLYARADWLWASPRAPVVSHGWTPERGHLRYDWRGYNEALLLYVLALGSPSYPVTSAAYESWICSYRMKSIYGHRFVYGGPLFVHQMAHAWIDFRGIQDRFMREHGLDYFENSRRATLVQREYARRNPRGFEGYGENCWGVSASTGPVHGYRARGVPFGPDDGTIAPWTTVASLPFAPEAVKPALLDMAARIELPSHGSMPGFNHTWSSRGVGGTWTAANNFAIDEGPVVMMIENHRSDLVWRLLRRSPFIRRGLERAGFTGGWLESE
jgi:hypothetical protein